MGAGKTTIGQLLADQLGWPLLDSDASLAAEADRTAAELAREAGAPALHAREAAILIDQLAAEDPAVIAAAASVVEAPTAVAALADAELLVVWLRGSPEVLSDRAIGGEHRPWHGQAPLAYLRERAATRDPLYARLAHVVVDVDRTSPDAAAVSILDALERSVGFGAGDARTGGPQDIGAS
jgi:shikimate kinase